jgi:hypothetical protein
MTILRLFNGDDNGLVKSVRFLIPDRRITKINADDPVTAISTVLHEKKDGARIQHMVTGESSDDHRLVSYVVAIHIRNAEQVISLP